MSVRTGTRETPDAAPRPQRTATRVLASLLVAALYYLGARLGLSLSLIEQNVTPLFPPTGIALAAYLLLGRSVWPGVALAAFAVNLPISTGPLPAAVTAAGNTVAPLVAVTLLGRVGFRRQLDRRRDALAIVFLGALLGMSVSATVGTASLHLSGAIPLQQVPTAWAVWWTGDAMGVLAFTPFLLALPLLAERPRWSLARWAEAGLILTATTAVVLAATSSDRHLLFLVLPVLGYAAWRLQLPGAAPAALVASLAASWSAAHSDGPFMHGSLFERMATLQAFNACVGLTSFFLAALVSERIAAARALEAAAAEDHQIAETLQRSLLPARIPELPGAEIAARYVPATADVQVGGDWYDVIALPDGMVGLAIGDVAGHGLQAASTMGQVRMGLRAYAAQDPAPVSVLTGLHRLVAQLAEPEMVTVLYLVFDPGTGEVRFANAGHPPALVITDDGWRYLSDALRPPLGVLPDAAFAEARHLLPAGATLVLYTDGLVERRGISIQSGLDLLAETAATSAGLPPDDLCRHLLTTLLHDERGSDDVALVALRPTAATGAPLQLTLRADSRMLAEMRGSLRRWLRESRVDEEVGGEILVAAGEACANVVRHAYPTTPGDMELSARLVDGSVEVVVSDRGTWREASDRGGGWGLQLMRELTDSLDVARTADGTVVRMRRRARVEVGA